MIDDTPKKEQVKIPIIRYYLISFCPLIVFLLIYSIVQIISDSTYSLTAPCTAEMTAEEVKSLEEIADELPKLKADIPLEDKLKILQAVADIETLHMNIPPVIVAIDNGHYGQAWYEEKTNTVYINERRYEKMSIKELVEYIAHECRHAYQRYIIRLLDCADDCDFTQNNCKFQDEHIYSDNFQNYQGDLRIVFDNKYYKQYIKQPVEADANRYAKHRMAIYNKYL